MLRIEISEGDQAPLPPLDLDDASFMIGSSPTARVRLPAVAAQAEHVRVEGGQWHDLVAGREGAIGEGATLELGSFRVRIAPAPEGAVATPPQRTESLARELLRGLLGSGAAPTLEVERGPNAGAVRKLAPPESSLIIGRGDEANWIIVDEDLSRTHAEIRRGWDDIRIVDLYSKNGTRIDGVIVGAGGAQLRDGALVELGKVALRFRDPADRQLEASPAPAPSSTVVASPSARVKAAEPPAPSASTPPPDAARAASAPAATPQSPRKVSAAPFYIAVTIMVAALVGLVWVLAV